MPMLFFKNYFKTQIFSTALLCFTSNCKLKETKIRRQTTITRGIRNSYAMLIQKSELVDQYEGLLCWFLLDCWQTSFKISPSYTLFGIPVFRNSGWSPDFHAMLHWATLLLSGMQDQKKKEGVHPNPSKSAQERYLVTSHLEKVWVFFKPTTAATVFSYALWKVC